MVGILAAVARRLSPVAIGDLLLERGQDGLKELDAPPVAERAFRNMHRERCKLMLPTDPQGWMRSQNSPRVSSPPFDPTYLSSPTSGALTWLVTRPYAISSYFTVSVRESCPRESEDESVKSPPRLFGLTKIYTSFSALPNTSFMIRAYDSPSSLVRSFRCPVNSKSALAYICPGTFFTNPQSVASPAPRATVSQYHLPSQGPKCAASPCS